VRGGTVCVMLRHFKKCLIFVITIYVEVCCDIPQSIL
jgi:hypothetical protein